ncbi:MAG: hypothetical protein JWM68_1997 [Verrucomicrobiales bacterium]|nr:hypothetical protein [Verrucomicrobiales bacterium]
MRLIRLAIILCGVLTRLSLVAQVDPELTPKIEEPEPNREELIKEYTRKMRAANFPALFNKAANEFKVPVSVLMGISFEQTRWEHLTWPPEDRTTPCASCQPLRYGIMGLHDDDYLGHSLLDAAKLIGATPEDLKTNVLQNMRGGAALLRKIYKENTVPGWSKRGELESWFYAVGNFSGLPDRDIALHSAWNVYDWMEEGYHLYGIEFDAVPLPKIEALRTEARKVAVEAQQARLKEEAKQPPVKEPKLGPLEGVAKP